MKQKGTSPILIVILILIIAWFGYAAYGYYVHRNNSTLCCTVPTPSPKSASQPSQLPEGWKTYTNKNLKFSFNYPGYFAKVEDNLPSDSEGGGASKDKIRFTKGDGTYDLDLKVHLNPDFGGMCWPYVTYKTNLDGDRLNFTKVDTKAKNTSNEVKCTPVMEADVVISDREKLKFDLSYPEKDQNIYEKDFEEILSSFRVIQ